MVLMFLWDAPLDVPGAPRDAEPREAAASAAPRVSVVEFAPVDGAAQLVLGEAAAQLRAAGVLGETAARVRETGAAGEAVQLREEPAEVDEPAGVRGPAEPDERAGIRARVRPPERVQARELARVRGVARIRAPAQVRGVDFHAPVGHRFDSALHCCDSEQLLARDSGQVLAPDAACSGAAADSHALR
jgi:hypothetical protein